MLLLDTHAWIWSAEGDTRKIGQRARRLIERAAAHDQIRVSPATIFEVTALSVAGRLRLAGSVEQWIDEADPFALIAAGPVMIDVRFAPKSGSKAVVPGCGAALSTAHPPLRQGLAMWLNDWVR